MRVLYTILILAFVLSAQCKQLMAIQTAPVVAMEKCHQTETEKTTDNCHCDLTRQMVDDSLSGIWMLRTLKSQKQIEIFLQNASMYPLPKATVVSASGISVLDRSSRLLI